jgi:GTP-binding protein
MRLFEQVIFSRAVHDLADLPPDASAEVAFAGRSNAGKSSAINALVNRKRLAFVSKTPGRTQTINFFSLDTQHYLVDLPGYGYSTAPAREIRHWDKLISAYLQTRVSLRGLVLIMDVRHAFTALDRRLLDWIAPLQKPAHVLLTKADKVGKRVAMSALQSAQAEAFRWPSCAVQLFSSTTGIGLGLARKTIAQWLT